MKILVKYLIFRYSIFMSDIETVTSNLKAEIARRGLSVLELAGCLGISVSMGGRMRMRPELRISELEKAAEYLGLDVWVFFQRQEGKRK